MFWNKKQSPPIPPPPPPPSLEEMRAAFAAVTPVHPLSDGFREYFGALAAEKKAEEKARGYDSANPYGNDWSMDW